MPNAFNFSVSPFDCLTQAEQTLVRDHLDVAYFRQGDVLLDVGTAPTHLFVLIKGYVQQFEDDELLATYGPNDSFDGRALVAGRSGSRFVAAEEVVAYELSHETVNTLIASNDTFSALLFSALGKKLSALAARGSEQEIQSLNLARIDEAYVRAAHTVPSEQDIVSVVKLFQQERTTNVLVRDASVQPPRLGIFTTNGLQRAILSGRPLDQLPVGELTSWNLLSVQPSDQVGEALALMLRHGVHRVVVREEDRIIGILESLDVFSFLSNHSMLIGMQIRDANGLEELEKAAGQITTMVRRQYRSGSRVGFLARLVQDLNARLFERAWALLAPPDLVENSCLVVMGSEGRGEQLLKTDQDNALILRDGYAPPPNLQSLCERFVRALTRFGYPLCPGEIMLSNPAWRMSVGDFARTVRRWLVLPDGDSLMNLAIFMDAHAVSGDASLLDDLKTQVFSMATDNDMMMSRFASVIDAFGSPTRWWQRMRGLAEGDARIDIKKAGIFPIVHGVRSLALAEHVQQTNTEQRIRALVDKGVLSQDTADELVESLHFFMRARLAAGLDELDQGKPVSGKVPWDRMTPLERDLLKDALQEVRRFKEQMRLRFRLGAVS
ncbi:MAG: putative nucleotidyltransferase substrate binding domain-containing protein [Lautropia sp.]|nr:putative nucleotidyltransferase substrate binding domain-containing protein [Lautropia sp.]